MAFYPQPQVIREFFNIQRFGPPQTVTSASPCPWLDHLLSGLVHMTHIAHFALAFASAPGQRPLTSPRRPTRRVIMQKARRHPVQKDIGLRPLVGAWFQVLFHSPNRGSFHLSLTLLLRYRSPRSTQPCGVGPADSRQVPRDWRYSGILPEVTGFRLRGCHSLWPGLPAGSTIQ